MKDIALFDEAKRIMGKLRPTVSSDVFERRLEKLLATAADAAVAECLDLRARG